MFASSLSSFASHKVSHVAGRILHTVPILGPEGTPACCRGGLIPPPFHMLMTFIVTGDATQPGTLKHLLCTGTGKEVGDRHPKVNDNVLIGASATILGNISIGKGAQVAAGSLVLKNVPPRTMVAGSPAKEVGKVTGEFQHLCPAVQERGWEVGRASSATDC